MDPPSYHNPVLMGLPSSHQAALDYFASFEKLPKIFEWHKSERLDGPTAKYLRSICVDVAFPSDEAHLLGYLSDTHALVMKNCWCVGIEATPAQLLPAGIGAAQQR